MYKQGSMERLGVPPVAMYPMDDGCLNRVPYSSVIAFVMCFVGVVMFAIMMVFSFNASVEQTKRALNIQDIPWLDKVHILFLIVAVVMVGMALYLLCVGILSTGSTREQLYKRSSARRGGRACCVIAIILSYMLSILWMFVLSITAILSALYYVFSKLCAAQTVVSENNCLDFSVFRPLIKDVSQSSLVLCGGTVQQFCAVANTAVTWYIVGFVGALIICLGLVQFLACNAANFSHVNHEERYSELRDIVFSESYPDYSPSPNIYAPPTKYPIGTPQLNGTMSTYNYGTQPRNSAPPHMMQQGSMHRQPANGTLQYPHSRRNSYHNSFHDNLGWNTNQY